VLLPYAVAGRGGSGLLGSGVGGWGGGSESFGPMQLPGTAVGVVRAPCTRLARWMGFTERRCVLLISRASGACPPLRPAQAAAGCGRSGGGPMSSVGRMRSMVPGGGEVAIGPAGQPPAALLDRPMGPADQGQVGQIGGAAVQPVDQMMALAPGQGPVTVGDHTAAVAHGQGGALGRGHDPAGPAQVQRLAGRAPSTGGNRSMAAPSRSPNPSCSLGSGAWALVSPVTGLGAGIVVGGRRGDHGRSAAGG
jgi:hypothetical protein